jgi:hypothetical protein
MMNLALGAVFLTILLFPALILVYVFGKGTHARRMPNFTLVEYFLLSSVLSIFIHGVAVLVMRQWQLRPDYTFIFKFLTSQIAIGNEESLNNQLEKYFGNFAWYTLVVCSSCAVAGWVIQKGVTWRWLRMRDWIQRFRGDRKPDALFCYFNDWWYFFRANEYSRDFSFLDSGQVLIYTDVIIDTKEATILYSGILVDFVLNDDGLEFIYLNGVSKRLFTSKDSNSNVVINESQSSEIPYSGILCIPYENIINLYIRFAGLDSPINEDSADDLQNVIVIQDPITAPAPTEAPLTEPTQSPTTESAEAETSPATSSAKESLATDTSLPEASLTVPPASPEPH